MHCVSVGKEANRLWLQAGLRPIVNAQTVAVEAITAKRAPTVLVVAIGLGYDITPEFPVYVHFPAILRRFLAR